MAKKRNADATTEDGQRNTKGDEKQWGSVPVLRAGPSDEGRPLRRKKRNESQTELHRRAMKDAEEPADEALAAKLASKAIEKRSAKRDTCHHIKWREKWKVCPDGRQSKDENPTVMTAALMREPEVEEFLDSAARRDEKRGRPSDHAVSAKVLLATMLDARLSSIKDGFSTIEDGNMATHFALRYPLNGVCGRQLNTLYDGKDVVLARADPKLWNRGALETQIALDEYVEDARSVCPVDGTWIYPATVEQRMGSSEYEAQLIDRGMGTRTKNYGRDGFGRGYCVTLVTALGTGVPIAWSLGSIHDEVEHRAVPGLLLSVVKRFHEEGKLAGIEYLVGDSKYDVEETCRTLLFGFGINPVFNRTHNLGEEYETGEYRNGVLWMKDRPAKYIETDGWPTEAKRLAAGLEPGEVVQKIDGIEPRIRYERADGGRRNAYPWKEPRIHTRLPFADSHPERFAMREEMEAMRNVAESNNARLQFLGLDAGARMPRWTKNARQFEHVLGARAWAVGRRALLRRNGGYDAMYEEFRQRGLLAESIAGRNPLHDQLTLFL